MTGSWTRHIQGRVRTTLNTRWSSSFVKPCRPRRFRVADDQEKRSFAGTVITPFGPLDLNFDRARELADLLPDPDLVRFVGLEEGLFANYLERQPLVPRQRQQIGDRSIVGTDGLVVAPIRQIIDLGFQTDQS